MKTNVDKEKYIIYNDIRKDLHCAINRDIKSQIETTIRKYKGSENVPEDDEHTVKGIYLQNAGENEFNMTDEYEVEIMIKYLRFNNL